MKILIFLLSFYINLVKSFPLEEEFLSEAPEIISEAVRRVGRGEDEFLSIKNVVSDESEKAQHSIFASTKPVMSDGATAEKLVADEKIAKQVPNAANVVSDQETVMPKPTFKERVSQRVASAKEGTFQFLDSVKSKSIQEMDEMKSKTAQSVSAAKEKTGQIKSSVKDRAARFTSATKEKTSRLASLSKEKLIKFKEFLASLLAKIVEKTSNAKTSVVNTASKAKSTLKEKAQNVLASTRAARDRFMNRMRKQPKEEISEIIPSMNE